jgi:amino-acid N-acetyltransferase
MAPGTGNDMKRIATTLTLRRDDAGDLAEILSLLERSALPTADVHEARPDFVLASDGAVLIGVGGLQRFGKVALLRSLAVDPAWRKIGVGGTIVRRLEALARDQSIAEIVLLTQTAKAFFLQHGYREISRDQAPAAVQESAEFRTLCGASATCMQKSLRPA